MGELDVSFLVVNYKNPQVTADCLESIQRAGLACTYETIVVDNCSGDGSPDFLRGRFPTATVTETERNGGFAYANNIGARLARGEYVALLNNDTLLAPGVLDRMLGYFRANDGIGAMGCRCVNGDGLEIPASHRFSSVGSMLRQVCIKPVLSALGLQRRLVARAQKSGGGSPRQVDWLTGSFLLMPRALYLELGGLDEGFFLYMEDEDLCRRVRGRGKDVVLWPEIGYTHLCGASTPASAFVLLEYMKSKYRYYSIYDSGRLGWYRALIAKQLRQFSKNLPREERLRAAREFDGYVRGSAGAAAGVS